MLNGIYPYDNPVLRDLLWVIESEPILTSSITNDTEIISSDYCKKEFAKCLSLSENDEHFIQKLKTHLDFSETKLLGKYFEALVEFWLNSDINKKLVKKGLQVHKGNSTLGEFDFLYEDLQTNEIIHLEVAGKFYISSKDDGLLENFIGPNVHDNLKRKLDRTIDYQLNLSKIPEGKEVLTKIGISKVKTQLLLKGYLFYHVSNFELGNFNFGQIVNPNHNKGWWIYESELELLKENISSKFMIIDRHSWMARQFNPDNKLVLEYSAFVKRCIDYFADNNYPILISVLEKIGENLIEKSRGFIVSDQWPNPEPHRKY